MIICRTPFRVSFLGGGTDYPGWYRANGGAVLATTIDKYCYITCRHLPPFFTHRYRIAYSKLEFCNSIDEIQHPSIRASLQHLGVKQSLEIHYDGDLPARSGMGSSSSFTVGFLHALHALEGRMLSKERLAREAITVEQVLLKENVGSQDQVLAAYGGVNHVTFDRDDTISVTPVCLTPERQRELNDHLMLFFTGINRTASFVAGTFINDFAAKDRQLRILRDLVDEGLSVLNGRRELSRFGELLDSAWQAKRSLSSSVSNSYVEQIYETAREHGAVGGKLTGAGGGGFMLLVVPPERQAAVRRALSRLIHVPFRFEFAGSQVIFFEPEKEYLDEEARRLNQAHESFRELHDLTEGTLPTAK